MIVCTYAGRFYNLGDAFAVNVNRGQLARTRQLLEQGGFTVTSRPLNGNRTELTAVCS